MHRFKRILGVIDLNCPAQTLVRRAVSLAQQNQAELLFVCVVPKLTAGIGIPDGGPISRQLQEAAVGEAYQRLDALLAPLRARSEFQTRVLVGTAFLEVIREVLRNGHDLVIKSPEDPDWMDRLFGSDDMHLLRKCPCPVWLVKPVASEGYRRILAAVDLELDPAAEGSAAAAALNQQIVEMAASLALADFAELHVAHAWQAIGEQFMRGPRLSLPDDEVDDYVGKVRTARQQAMDQLLAQVIGTQAEQAEDYLAPQKHLLKGYPREVIPAVAKQIEADLVVMGTIGRTGVPGLFIGNTAEEILDQIGCSVLAVKPAGFVSPVTL